MQSSGPPTLLPQPAIPSNRADSRLVSGWHLLRVSGAQIHRKSSDAAISGSYVCLTALRPRLAPIQVAGCRRL